MTAIDYNAMAAVAEQLIDENGREITIFRFDQTFTDSAKPWKGPTDPRGTPDETATLNAVFVPISGAASLGMKTLDQDLLKRTEQVCLIAPGVTSVPFDLATANEIIDGGVNSKVTFVETLKPGDTVLLYYVGVSR